MFTIDEIRIEGEENGFHLVIHLDDPDERYVGWTHRPSKTHRYRIGLPDQFHAETERTIGRWLAEGEAARIAMPGLNGDGYEPTDPKHPDYHDTMSNIHDNREGK